MTLRVAEIARLQNFDEYKELHWEGSFDEYLDIVRRNPAVIRSAHQRVYDMIESHGREEYIDSRKKLVRYPFFRDEANGGKDAIYGLDIPLMRLVNVFRSAAMGYGTEKRVLLLHGPVGSSKSTIARILKKGLEAYSRSPGGALYTFEWRLPDELAHIAGSNVFKSPMNEEPLKLVPEDWRRKVFEDLGLYSSRMPYPVQISGQLDPASRFVFNELMLHYGGDWSKVIQHVVVKRLVLSEKDRIGIGTFQPKDEKNQDSTELSGDINYRKIAEFGSDSDPRAFNFDGEFNIANRGIIEFIEVLKLDVAFLYDLLGVAGAQDQAQEVRPDGHRRGDHRSHQRGRVQEAPQQRVHGGAPRPDGEDRHPVHHQARRRDQDLRQRTTAPSGSRSTSLPTPWRWRRCGRC